jgi:peptidyl-prolyl cis-trans isomerase A (cyclophilin A)
LQHKKFNHINHNMKHITKSLPLFLIIFTALFTSCHNKPAENDATGATTDTTHTAPAQPVVADDNNWPTEDGLYGVFYTPKGKIVTKLEYIKAPMTVGNFIALAEGNHPLATVNKGKPFYDGLTFHRVEPGFVIQGGDPNGNGSGDPGYKFPNEVDPTLRHSRAGTLAMANAGPNTNGSQIYITLAPTPMLDGGYSVFGYVVAGQGIASSIAKGDNIDSVRIVRVGDAAKAYNAVTAFTTANNAAKKKLDDAMATQKGAWDGKVKAKFPTAKKTASGLYYVIDKPGNGALAKAGQTVTAHYTGTLWDGKKFDSSLDRGQPFSFVIGQHQVIPGWDEGFALLKVGTKGKLIIPSYLAYGDRGAGDVIPPNADLIFDVEMIGVK